MVYTFYPPWVSSLLYPLSETSWLKEILVKLHHPPPSCYRCLRVSKLEPFHLLRRSILLLTFELKQVGRGGTVSVNEKNERNSERCRKEDIRGELKGEDRRFLTCSSRYIPLTISPPCPPKSRQTLLLSKCHVGSGTIGKMSTFCSLQKCYFRGKKKGR